jgi:hypothetical protein
METCRPDFIVIGAMKSATSTLREQLARQPGLFMARIKEPSYFSDDDVYAQGADWYASLFSEAAETDLRGESSTHYTKLPTYPHTIERMTKVLPWIKLVYLMRHPIDRLISHYIHDRSMGKISVGIEEAIDGHPELVDYGLYAMQLRPYIDAYGIDSILPVFFGRLVLQPQEELERICRFIGYPGTARWDTSLGPQNVGAERLLKSEFRDAFVQFPVLSTIRRRLVPKPLSKPIKAIWRIERPGLSAALKERLADRFDPDLDELGSWFGLDLSCANFSELTEAEPQDYARDAEIRNNPKSNG